MQVSCSEGVAIHTGPESCVAVREDRGEALTGDSIGQPLSRERIQIRTLTPFTEWKATRLPRYASDGPVRRGRRPWHVQTLLEREPGDLGVRPPYELRRSRAVRGGEARSHSCR